MKPQRNPLISVPTGIDPFARPASDVTIEEWRILISSIAGPLRLSQGASRNVVVPAGGAPILVASNDKSYALFVSIRQAAGFVLALGSDPRSANANVGIAVGAGAIVNQVLLPKERIYATSTAGGTLVVTEVTV